MRFAEKPTTAIELNERAQPRLKFEDVFNPDVNVDFTLVEGPSGKLDRVAIVTRYADVTVPFDQFEKAYKGFLPYVNKKITVSFE